MEFLAEGVGQELVAPGVHGAAQPLALGQLGVERAHKALAGLHQDAVLHGDDAAHPGADQAGGDAAVGIGRVGVGRLAGVQDDERHVGAGQQRAQPVGVDEVAAPSASSKSR